MPIIESRAFAYNTGGAIAGTTQIGDLAVGTPTVGFEASGVQFWNGPSESTAYIIARGSSAQPTPIFGGAMSFSTTYKGSEINNTPGGTVVSVTVGNKSQSILSTTLINNNDKVMFSVAFTSDTPGPNNAWIGVGTLFMNYNGPSDGFPGSDSRSVGFNQLGEIWFNGGMIQSGLPYWESGDIIDVAVDHVNNNIWIRINGGSWAGNPAGAIDPSTNQGGVSLNGLTSFYPVLSPGSGGGSYGTMVVYLTAPNPVPTGFQFAGTNQTGLVGFLKSQVKTDVSFVTLVNGRFNQSFPLDSGGATLAKGWLDTQGYWTNYH